MMRKLINNRLFGGVLIALVISLLLWAIAVIFGSGVHKWHLKLADSLYSVTDPAEEIIIIAIDDKSTEPAPLGLGRFTRWERDNYAQLLEALEKDKPKVVAFDFLFNNPGNVETDDEFAEKIAQAGNVILEFAATDENTIYPLQKFSENSTLGLVQATPDSDGVNRRIPIKGEGQNSLAFEAVKQYLGGMEPEVPLEDNKMLINYFADPFGYKMIPFIDVIDGNVPTGTFKDKLVFVGIVSFKEIQDKALVPKSNEIPMPGVEIHANAAQTILQNKFLTNQNAASQIIAVAIIALGLTLAFNYLGIILSATLAIFSIAAYIFAAHFLYRRGLIINMVYPFAAIILAYIFSWVYKYFIADKSKREIRSAFSHYVSEKVVNEITKNPDLVKVGGEKKVVTVFFSDLKDSTAISEKIEITEWVHQINEYFTVMENVIKKLDGTLDKYEGDAIMGFWNAPISQENHVLLAYSAALEMRTALEFLNQKWQKEGRPQLQFRVGMNTGEVIVGNFGSNTRFDYTVMGDVVNTASRLESTANKTYGTTILVNGIQNADIQKLSDLVIRKIDTVLLPGKNTPVELFELVCFRKNITPELEKLLRTYSSGLAAYYQKDWQTAISTFASLPSDSPARVMLERCRKLQQNEKVPGLDEEKMIFRIAGK